MEITEKMLDEGQHVLSEWLNDNAPIGEARYRSPAKACFEAMFALAAPASAEPVAWTDELEAARVKLCEFWIGIADDPQEGGVRYPELGRKAIETEQALTILGEIAKTAAPASAGMLEDLLRPTEGYDQNQPGYMYRKGWNDAILYVMHLRDAMKED